MTRNNAHRSDDRGSPRRERARQFVTTVTVDDQGRTYVPLPFNPDDVWGPKHRHHVTGSLGGCDLRRVIDRMNDGHVLVLGPSWNRHGGPSTSSGVEVVLEPEGPQRDDLAPDITAAVEAAPDAVPSSTRSPSSTATPT